MVILYTQDNCPKCNQLKMILDKSCIEYVENKSIEEMLALGFDKTPVLSVDGKDMYFVEASEWIKENCKGRGKL